MVFFYLTNTALEITAGVAWWLTNKTASGIYYGTKYLMYGPELTEEQIKEIEIIELDCEKKDNEIYQGLLDEIKNLREEIKEIKDNKCVK